MIVIAENAIEPFRLGVSHYVISTIYREALFYLYFMNEETKAERKVK